MSPIRGLRSAELGTRDQLRTSPGGLILHLEMHERYEEWLDYLFGHEVATPAWHWASDAPVFEASELDYAVLIGETFRHSGRDLLRFTDAQLNQGLILLASAACSDYMQAIKDARIPMAIRLATIRSIFDLYRDCFQARCTETLSHLNRTGRSALNEICYMFWDISVLCPATIRNSLRDN